MNVIDSCFFNENWTCKMSYLVIRNLQNYCVINHSDCTHRYYEVDVENIFCITNRQRLCSFSWQVLPTISRYTHGHKLCSSFGWLIFIFICSRIYSKACATKNEKLVMDFNSIFWIEKSLGIPRAVFQRYHLGLLHYKIFVEIVFALIW